MPHRHLSIAPYPWKYRGPGRQQSRCAYGDRIAGRRNVTAAREAIPLNRLFERKRRDARTAITDWTGRAHVTGAKTLGTLLRIPHYKTPNLLEEAE